MALLNSIPQLVSDYINIEREKSLVAKKMFNSSISNEEIQSLGQTIRIPGVTQGTAVNYTGADVNYTDVTDTSVLLTIDQSKYYAAKLGIEDEYFAKNADKIWSQIAKDAAYQLNKSADTYCLGLYTKATGGTVTKDLSPANILAVLAQIASSLEDLDVKEKIIVVPPAVKYLLSLQDVQFSLEAGSGVEIANKFGMEIVHSTNVPSDDDSGDTRYYMLAMAKGAGAFADRVVKTYNEVEANNFNQTMRSLYYFGAELIRPAECMVLKGTVVDFAMS